VRKKKFKVFVRVLGPANKNFPAAKDTTEARKTKGIVSEDDLAACIKAKRN